MGRLKTLPPLLASLPPRVAMLDTSAVPTDTARTFFAPWRKLYKTARWRALRMHVLTRDLFTCQRPGCGRVEADTSQLVADHVRPHRGDEALFWDESNLQTLCKPCHDGAKQREEHASRHHR